MIREIVVSVLLLLGGGFILLAGIGIIRMPDLFSRMQAATKSGTLGIGIMMVAMAVHFDDLAVTARSLLVIVFFFITAPVAAHMIARAAYFVGVPLWEGTVRDELRGQYDAREHTLESRPTGDMAPLSGPPPDQPRDQGK
jgi:multicomponent Na+:H+ antiporter subunit G